MDARSDRVFVASESGTAFEFSDKDRVTLAGQGFVGPNAHSVAVDSRRQLLYFPLESVAGNPVLRIMAER
jgi:hypothetical protein